MPTSVPVKVLLTLPMRAPPPALLSTDPRANMPAAVEDDNDTERDNYSGSFSSACARTPAECMAFRVAQRSPTPINVRRVTQAHGTGSRHIPCMVSHVTPKSASLSLTETSTSCSGGASGELVKTNWDTRDDQWWSQKHFRASCRQGMDVM